MNKFYYAVFEKEGDGYNVHFPDLPGCLTFGENIDNAFEMAADVLAAWVSLNNRNFLPEPSKFSDIMTDAGCIYSIISPIWILTDVVKEYVKSGSELAAGRKTVCQKA